MECDWYITDHDTLIYLSFKKKYCTLSLYYKIYKNKAITNLSKKNFILGNISIIKILWKNNFRNVKIRLPIFIKS